MRRRSSSNGSRRRSSIIRRRSENVRFDEFGFAITKKKEQKLQHRSHEYSYPQLSTVRVKELCELLSYWNGASFLCKNQIERFIRMGIPSSLRGQVWKCLLCIENRRQKSHFNYEMYLAEVRGPLVDLGVSEYGILSAIATLSETQNDLGTNQQQLTSSEMRYSVDDITLFRQIALDLQRSFPTHRSLMGDSPEAIEGQAKLFRVLVAYARYNPQVGYSQGMSYIAAVLLMQLAEEEAFWALTALLDQPQYVAELFDLSLSKIQHQVKVFEQLLKHRKPKLSQHLESVGLSSVHFVMPWFLTLFTSLPCWDSVLAVWDLTILHGLSAVFRTALTIIELLEPRLMGLNDEGAMLPLLLRVPVDVAQYCVLIPALWNTEVQDWELKCMNSLVLDETNSGPIADSVGKGVLSRVLHLAQRFLLEPIGRQREDKKTRTQSGSQPQSPSSGQGIRGKTSASLTQAQIRARRRSQHRGGTLQPVTERNGTDVTPSSTADAKKSFRSNDNFKRTGTGSSGKGSRRRSNHSLIHPLRVRSLRLLKSNPLKQNSPTSPVLPPTLQSFTLSPASTPPASTPSASTHPASTPSQGQEQARLVNSTKAFLNELSSRHQTSAPFNNVRESALI
ncbi:uncharacterized protein si:ch211-266k8.4 isoform X2 [Periophthalmus magnuspinnatus]|uniref:uncharacterized protein si:ch211-266k8.4 isoform X2 n=1 Tax=Periophthalmus magnuspinnatus TaxID=409849 RepID=UPI0024370D29|nr:uncharacterized protein si:ch211-266k8.4 isoform X2 [Periophthalmus magnuspinnatus]